MIDNIVFNNPEKIKEILEKSKTDSENFGNILSCHDAFTAKISDQLKNLATISRKEVKMQKEKYRLISKNLEQKVLRKIYQTNWSNRA